MLPGMFRSDTAKVQERIKNAFAGRVDSAGPLYMPAYILPVLEVDYLLRDYIFHSPTLDLSAASAWTIWVPILSCPKGHRYRIWAITLPTALAADAGGVRSADCSAGVPTGFGSTLLHGGMSTAAIGVSGYAAYPIVLSELWQLGCFNTAQVGDNARKLNVVYTDEVLE